MSSTEPTKDAPARPGDEGASGAAAARLFDEVLAPLAARLREAGAVLADVAPRRAADSYFEPVSRFTRADFEIVSGGDPETLRLALLQQWKAEPSLHDLVEGLVRLAGEVDVEREQSAEVSPFLYVMF